MHNTGRSDGLERKERMITKEGATTSAGKVRLDVLGRGDRAALTERAIGVEYRQERPTGREVASDQWGRND